MTDDFKAGQTFHQRFVLQQCLGYGGMAAVWSARHIESGRLVALKILHQHFMEKKDLIIRFFREAQGAIGANYSARIVEILDMARNEWGVPYLVMEYLCGEDLRDIIRREGQLAIERAVSLAIQTCMALDEVHRNGIIHRDIKPENIFVTRLHDGCEWVKILDFGVAKFQISPDDEISNLTYIGHAVGTPHYMAPEQAIADIDVDHRVDIYSIGAVLYEMVTGVRPFEADDWAMVIAKVTDGEYDAPKRYRKGLDPQLISVLHKAMAKDREERFETMMDFANSLEPFSGSGATYADCFEETRQVLLPDCESPSTITLVDL